MANWLKSILRTPEPAGPVQTIRRFESGAATLSSDCVAMEPDGWLVDSQEGRTVRLFEVAVGQLEQCLVTYKARLRSESLSGRAYLEMWCRLPARGEFFSKGIDRPITGTTDWASCEIPFYLKKGQRCDLVKLDLTVEGAGKVWIKDIELLKTPLA